MANYATRPLSIFIVENHADTLKYFRMYLEDAGHTVFEAGNMADALAAIPESHCEVLISDIGLPDGDGWELLRRLCAEHRAHPSYAIATSGFGMNADRARSKAAGYRHHLLKPLNPDDIDAVLNEAALELATAGVHH